MSAIEMVLIDGLQTNVDVCDLRLQCQRLRATPPSAARLNAMSAYPIRRFSAVFHHPGGALPLSAAIAWPLLLQSCFFR
jgi:hypothetical protein